ncbi:MAG TPA: acyltransferase [Telluria sp.]
MQSERIHGLDTLRALAIVLVMLQHYVLFVSNEDTFGFIGTVGWIGVDLFFALSGYLIGNQIFAALRSDAGFSLGRFYARRFLRTLPNFYVVLALYALWPAFRGGLELPELWRFLTFTQNINLTPGTAFSHAWSLNIEEQFYMVLPAVALMFAAARAPMSRSWLALALVVLAGIAARALLWDQVVDGQRYAMFNYYKYIYYSSLCRLDELVAGVALAMLRNYHPDTWARISARGNATFAAGCAVVGLAIWLFLQSPRGFGVTVFGYPLLALGFGLLVLAAVSQRSTLRTLRIPGAASIALWSYAIYLLHKQVMILLAPVLARAGYAPGEWQAVVASFVASVLAGLALYLLVETPFMKLRERFVPASAARRSGFDGQAERA